MFEIANLKLTLGGVGVGVFESSLSGNTRERQAPKSVEWARLQGQETRPQVSNCSQRAGLANPMHVCVNLENLQSSSLPRLLTGLKRLYRFQKA